MATDGSPATSTITSTPSSQSTGSAQESCEICDALEKLLDATDFELDLDESQVYDDFCAEHSPLFEWINTRYYQHFDSLRKAQILRPDADYELAVISLLRFSGSIPLIQGSNYKGSRYQTYELLLHSKDSSRQDHRNAPVCVMDPEWINLKIAKSWVKKCITEHNSGCQSSGEKHVSPAWLIDTEENCLVPGNDSLSFVALSYRWGSATSRQMDKKAFQDLMRPGSFAQNNDLLTPTVKDAIYIVRTMGERYLWVDAICLEPEDEEQLVKQLQLMGSIYASAKLTIIALDGDASTGLKGTNPKSSPRSLPDIFPWRNGKSVMVRHLPALSVHDTEASEYFARGWTYQEFTGNVHVRVGMKIFPQLHDTAERSPTQAFPNIKKGWPDYKELLALLNEYNSRELKYPEDAFPAANGLLSYLENYSFDQGFLFGLPRASFDAALMWSCYFGIANLSDPVRPGLSRRQRSDRRHSILPDTYLPSWSWIGWQGADIRMLDREARFLSWDSSSNSCIEDLADLLELSVLRIPITQWYSLSSADGAGKQPISTYPAVYKENPEISYDEDVWTVKEKVDGSLIPSETGVTHLYEHVNFPGREFFWPLPKASPEGSDQPTKLGQSPFISCHTNRAWFGAAQQRYYILEVKMDVHLGLFDAKRRLCGWLQLPNFKSSRNSPNFLTPIYEEAMERNGPIPLAKEGTFLNPFPPRDMQLELVAICIRKYPEIYEDREMQLQEFYGVLWVEWTDGVAYRKGCGYVLKELWEEQDLEDVDLILG